MPPSDYAPPLELRDREPNDLVGLAREGCADAFEELHRQFWPRLVQLLRPRLGGSDADAEDVAQEALARAFGRLNHFNTQYRFSTWLYTIAFRLAHDRWRSKRRQPKLIGLDAAQHCMAKDASEAAEEQREQVTNLWQLAQSTLEPTQYLALWLRYGEDLPVADVARILNRTQIATRVLLHRARIKLIAARFVSIDSGETP